MSYTQELADFAANLRYEDLPREVVEQVKLLTLHVLGVSLAGCQSRQGKEAVALAQEMGGARAESTIIGQPGKVSAAQAAFANGTLADVLDWEDCSQTGHPSSGAIPAALAMAEKVHASGKEYITAIVAGYEVFQRISLAVQPTREAWSRKGLGLTSWQIFAAPVPAAKLLKLDREKMAQAFGVAGLMTPIVNSKALSSRSDMFHYQFGLTCRDGIVSALIANGGINPIRDVLDGENGYWTSVSDTCRWEWMNKGIGKDYLIMDTLFKHWPVNMWVQQYLDLMDEIVKEEGLRADEVAEIIVTPSYHEKSKGASRMLYRPEGYLGLTDAQFSIPYCLAAFLLDPAPGPDWYTDAKLKDPKLLELAAKVRAEGEELSSWKAFGMFQKGEYPEATLEVIRKDGRRIRKFLHFPKGHPRNRLSREEFEGRFRHAASFTLQRERIEKTIGTVFSLEGLGDISTLTDSLHN